jgi:EAL domain-containing protein (putative c-di-GMP-specific phosphodiesterase class I)
MFGKKVVDRSREKRAVNHEQALLDFAHQSHNFRHKASAAVIRLSQAVGFGYDNFLYAINMFKSLVTRFQGSLFILANRDLVFTYYGPPGEPAVKDAIFKVRLLFDLPHGEAQGDQFATWYDLEANHEDFLRFAEDVMAAKRAAATTAELQSETRSGAHAPVQAPALLPERPSLEALDKFLTKVNASDLSTLLRRQPICRIVGDGPPQVVLHEIYVSIADLERRLMPGLRLLSDRYLFQFASHDLDKRVLQVIRAQMEVLPAASFSLNINVATVISPEFEAFDAMLSPAMRSNLVLELPRVDVMADLSMFLAVRDRAKERGYRLCLDGLSALIMPYIRLQDLGFDLFKIGWSRDLIEERGTDQLPLLQGVVDRCGAERMILCHCDTADAIHFGSQLGITLYQGRHVDALLGKTG